jgi:outer membrane receptor protein involved in Fe transport
MFIHTNINTANPKFKDNIDGNNYIPLAPTFTNTGGVSISPKNNLKANLNYRLVSDRAANEDNSIVAEGYTVFDLNVIYTIKNISIGFEVNNVFNTDWKETQFATESRLQNENTSVEEIHFTPGFPRFIKGKLSYMF